MKSIKSLYRPDIDALRAIAVISVIVFHLRESWLPGGYIGVDVFFVISGFLITSQIGDGLARGQFSFVDFYVRRIRRILPALLVMIIFTILVSLVLLRPEAAYSYGASLLGQAISAQNFVFLAEGEYFVGADSKPLLHTWSLAVEEQFYFVWPAFLWFFCGVRKKFLPFGLATFATGSFALNIIFMEISPKTSFFMFPMRAWELVLGAMASYLAVWSGLRRIPEWLAAGLAMLGLLMVFSALLYFNPKTSFPGYAALLPVSGALLFVLFGASGFGKFFSLPSLRWLVGIGLISYSLYLWHWPVIAFAKILEIDFDFSGIILILLTTGILSWSCYHLVEVPIRRKHVLGTRHALLLTVGFGLILVAATGVTLLATKGGAFRYGGNAAQFLTASFDSRSNRCGLLFKVISPTSMVCRLDGGSEIDRKVLVWGNSHADMWTGALLELATSEKAALFLNSRNCRATADWSFCNEAVQSKVLIELQKVGITDVVLAATWFGGYELSDRDFESLMEKLLTRLGTAKVRVWFVVDVPSGDALSPVSAYNANPSNPIAGSVPNPINESHLRQIELFERLSQRRPWLRIIDPTPAFCDSERCKGGTEGEVWYRDTNHLTNSGALRALEYFRPAFATSQSRVSQ